MRHHITAFICLLACSANLSFPVLAQPTALSAQVSLEARASTGADADIQSASQDWSTAGVLSPLTASVTANAADAGVTVTTTGSVSAAWTDAASGVVTFDDVGWTASNCPVSSCAAQLNLNPAHDWSYAFTADADGTFTMDWTVAADATTTDTLGLIGISFFWDGVLQYVLRLTDGSGTVSMPVQAGQTYTVGLRNGANLSGFVGSPVSLMDAAMQWTLTAPPVPLEIDVKPGGEPNCFNINGNGTVPVAILGSADLDVADIDTRSDAARPLSFNGLDVRVRGNRGPLCMFEYVNADTYQDLVCHFEDDASQWQTGSDAGTLTGQLLDGTLIQGSDTICVVP